MWTGALRLRWWLALSLIVLLLTVPWSAKADGWETKGGDSSRTSYVPTTLGLMQAEDWWRDEWTEFGPSATQPVVVDDAVYHLAGAFLWRLRLDSAGKIAEAKALGESEGLPELEVNVDPKVPGSSVKVSSSSPTLSPSTGIIYFGTAHGYLWGYDTRRQSLSNVKLGGCPVVSSPLVLNLNGRDVVVLGDKADRAHCASGGGNVWVAWGFDQDDGAPNVVSWSGATVGGWVTPSPVQGAEPNTVMLGSDGHSASCKGRATVVRVIPAGSGYDFTQDWANPLCGSTAQGRGGFAGSFASDGETAYWVDTAGALWAHNLANGAPRWPAHPTGLPLAPLLGGKDAFTNTEPAIDLSSGLVYVTLRNFRLPGDSFSLQGGTHSYQGETLHAPGAPGALVAIDRTTGTKKWQQIFRPQGTDPLWDYPAINTAPLVIRTRGVVVAGDAMGFIHAFDLTTGADATLFIDRNCVAQSKLDLKGPGERPMRSGQASWSQVSGVGVDPAFGSRLLLMGVNVFREGQGTRSFGRMAAIRAGEPYNLRWADAHLDPGESLQAEKPASFRGTVTMDLAAQPLGTLRGGEPVEVVWFVVDDAGYQRRLPGSATLPDSLTANTTAPAELSFTLTDEDPAKGYIMGVIDPPTIALHGAGALQDTGLQAAADAGTLTPQCHQGMRESAEIIMSADGTSLSRGLPDNTIKLPYELSQPLDLAVVLEAPATVDYRPDGRYAVTIRMRNLSGTAVVAPGAMQDVRLESTSLGSQTLSRRPLLFGPYQERVNSLQVPMGACGSRSVVRVELNAANDPVETDRSNNVAQVLTIVGPCESTGSGEAGNFQGGEGRSIIVPPDCIPNPDLNDPRPCTNYDRTVDDW